MSERRNAERRDPRADELLAAVDLLAPSLEASGLEEVELEVGAVRVRLARRRAATAPAAPVPAAAAQAAAAPTSDAASTFGQPSEGTTHVTAPLTGVWYGAPSPGARAYVAEGQEITAGQVIGLIEAMKLFNEIKSDVTGTVSRLLVESGTLVKRKQPLLEVRPG